MSLVIAGAEYIEKVAFVRAATGVLELGGGGGAHHMLQSGDDTGFI